MKWDKGPLRVLYAEGLQGSPSIPFPVHVRPLHAALPAGSGSPTKLSLSAHQSRHLTPWVASLQVFFAALAAPFALLSNAHKVLPRINAGLSAPGDAEPCTP
jgi:hypothetical protein